jgi:ADP-heptose:LPS heptosyltransferase
VDLNRHIVEKNCQLLDYLDISYSPEDCRPYLPNSGVSAEMKDFLQKLDSQAIVGINLSAGKKPNEWSIEKWVKLFSKFSEKVMILAMPDRAQDKIKLEESFPNVLKSPQTHSIYEAGQIIKRLQLLITPDTSLIHAASCYGTPVVGLYPNVEVGLQRFSPYGIPHQQLVSPTHKSEDIPIERVLEAVAAMLGVEERN